MEFGAKATMLGLKPGGAVGTMTPRPRVARCSGQRPVVGIAPLVNSAPAAPHLPCRQLPKEVKPRVALEN